MTEIAGKVWGNTRFIFSANSVEVHRIEVNKGASCSKHLHRHKNNAFFVESGRLEVDVWKNDYPLVDKTVLGPGDYMTVRPGEYHQFRALEDTAALEIYSVTLDPEDIVRESAGTGV